MGKSIVHSGFNHWQAEHIPGALHLDMVSDLSAPSENISYGLPAPGVVQTVLRRLGVENDDIVVLYGSGYLGPVVRCWWVLKASGVQDVRILDGGFEAWKAMHLPVSQQASVFPESRFLAVAQPSMLSTMADVETAMQREDTCLVNALSFEQFCGSGGAHYGRPGRIPGSTSVPFRSLLEEGSSWFKTKDAITAIFSSAGVLQSEKIINYCGGGIAASGTAFALHLIGREDASLYDGSLIEWCADAQQPLDVGLKSA